MPGMASSGHPGSLNSWRHAPHWPYPADPTVHHPQRQQTAYSIRRTRHIAQSQQLVRRTCRPHTNCTVRRDGACATSCSHGCAPVVLSVDTDSPSPSPSSLRFSTVSEVAASPTSLGRTSETEEPRRLLTAPRTQHQYTAARAQGGTQTVASAPSDGVSGRRL